MAIELGDYETKVKEAVQVFWGNREKASQKQAETGNIDKGARGSVTAGKHMEGFIALIADIVKANGLPETSIHRDIRLVTLPGFFRARKLWDLVVVHQGKLIAAIELKGHVGSISNNFNNRVEETIGTAHDFWTAYEKDAFGKDVPPPFLGWLMIAEDAPESNKSVGYESQHFEIFPEFQDTSYLERYSLLCDKMVKQKLYSAASVIASPQTAKNDGAYREIQKITGLNNFFTKLAGHIAVEAARSAGSSGRQVPLYDLTAAAGDFSELQHVKDKQWISVPDGVHVTEDMFACKVVGESMNLDIPNGSVCLFRLYPGGPRDGEIVLVQFASSEHADIGARYTVKKYSSTKKQHEDGTWTHDTITLSPRSSDTQYKAIQLHAGQAEALKVIGFFVRVLPG